MSVEHNKRLSRERSERKARFRAALAIQRLTANQWADMNDTHPAYVSRVLSGKAVSQPMVTKIEAFIAKHLRDVA